LASQPLLRCRNLINLQLRSEGLERSGSSLVSATSRGLAVFGKPWPKCVPSVRRALPGASDSFVLDGLGPEEREEGTLHAVFTSL